MPTRFVGVHEDRNTTVTFGEYLSIATQPLFVTERDADDMARTPSATRDNVVLLPGIGWRLRSYHLDAGKSVELTAAQSSIRALSEFNAATSAVEGDLFRQKGLTGLTYDGSVQSSGSKGITRRVGASGTYADGLTADQIAYSSPDTAADTLNMVRYMASYFYHNPSDDLYLRFSVPGGQMEGSGTLLTFYFVGPAGSDENAVGKGQYALKLFGDARAQVWERTIEETWILRHVFMWAASANFVYGATHAIAIINNCDPTPPFYGNRILFIPSSVTTAHNIGSPITALISSAISVTRQAQAKQEGFLYQVPRQTDEPTYLASLRVDVRADIRPVLQIATAKYPEDGTLYDDTFSLPFYPTEDESLQLEWYGRIPTGTTLTAQLFDADTDTVLADESTVLIDDLGGVRTYTPTLRGRNYRVKVTFESDATQTLTPTLTKLRVIRWAVYSTPEGTPVTIPIRDAAPALPRVDLTRVDIKGITADNTIDEAILEVIDYTGELDFTTQTGQPVLIESEFAGGSAPTPLFRGYVESAIGEPWKGDNGSTGAYGGYQARKYTIACTGESVRLVTGLTPERYSFWNEDVNVPLKATSALRILLESQYDTPHVNIPDINIRLFSTDSGSYIVEPAQNVKEIVNKIARDYLGAYVIWDNYQTTNPAYTLLEQKAAPYNVLARFHTDHPGSGKLPHVEASYGNTTSGSQTIVGTYIKNDTMNHRIDRPDANAIMVLGGAGGDDSSVGTGQRLSQVAINFNSYNPYALASGDPGYPDITHPDYLGYCIPLYFVELSLSTQEAVNWVARRLYDYLAHSRTVLTFEAPMCLVIDADDANQDPDKPRPLRFYDIVEVYWKGAWTKFIVLECDPSYKRDKTQFARYTLVRPSNMDEKASVMPPEQYVKLLAKAAKQAMGSPWKMTGLWSANNSLASASGVTILPEKSSSAIQDIDPASSIFGDFNFMPDFDPIL